ncbi:Ldh family oxidoreductase [archaeon]|jgi:L-2-hydroxycarboxylate dehydrogenase (NAD+)|nr:Ldh family oxidoreductase [archaeon]MBT6761856.1 Ldh family oxidoreductase [archaeon]
MDKETYLKQYESCKWVAFDELEKFMQEVLVKIGVPATDAPIISDVLITSDKRGIDSHGIGRFKSIYIDRIDDKILNPITKIDSIRDNKTVAVLDGNNGMGMVVSKHAMNLAISKAKEFGMGMVAVRNSTHYGIAGYYALMAAKAGMIGITGTNARPSVAPTFGSEGMLGTNPLTIGFPTDEEFPFILDCATSAQQRGKIESYSRMGKSIPEGWVVSANGGTITDPDKALAEILAGNAACLPIGGAGDENGGHKGYGYSVFVEVMSAALQQGAFLKALSGFGPDGSKISYPLGHFFLAIDVSFFTERESFEKISGEIMRDLRASRKAVGEDRIYTAGEKEYLAQQFRSEKGCPVPLALQKQMTELRDRFELDYKFEWD